jgi:integrase
MARSKHGSYLFQRDGSDKWWIKVRSAGKRTERSLGTVDRREAEILALPLIAEHKANLLAARPRIEPTWEHEYAPDREHVGPDGGRIFATERELFYLDAQGVMTRKASNGGPAFQLTSVPRLGFDVPVPVEVTDAERPKLAVKNGDDALLETYLKHADLAHYSEREARDTWSLYKSLTDSKVLKDATRDDGRKLVEYFENQGLKSATIKKKLTWLSACCNLAIDEGKLPFNPFASIAPNRDDKLIRLPLDAADMKSIKREIGRLDKPDQVLLRLLAATGMRLSEAFEIESEKTERGVRYVIIGRKTEQSMRRVPLPAAVLPYLPKSIKGPVFGDDGKPRVAERASKRLNRFLREIGITEPCKVVHSLRHRAKDQLRAAGCPLDVQYELLGHEESTVARGYGRGSPVPLLKKWIDKIGL